MIVIPHMIFVKKIKVLEKLLRQPLSVVTLGSLIITLGNPILVIRRSLFLFFSFPFF